MCVRLRVVQDFVCAMGNMREMYWNRALNRNARRVCNNARYADNGARYECDVARENCGVNSVWRVNSTNIAMRTHLGHTSPIRGLSLDGRRHRSAAIVLTIGGTLGLQIVLGSGGHSSCARIGGR